MSEKFERYRRPTLPHERQANPAFRAGGLAAAGIEFALVVGLFVLAGRWLDGRLDAEPWFTITLTLLGVAAAMTLLIRQAVRLGRSGTGSDDGEGPTGTSE